MKAVMFLLALVQFRLILIYLGFDVLVVKAAPPEPPPPPSPLERDPPYPSTESSSISTEPFSSTEPTEYQQNITGPTGTFRKGFAAYEKKINIFIENMRRTYMSMYSDNIKFTGELGKYEDQLPNKTRPVTRRYRERCYCESQFWTPCPERCMVSCRYHNKYGGLHIQDNCTKYINDMRSCWCHEGSTVTCDHGNLENCYELKTVQEPVLEPCVEFAPNRTIIETSYMRFSELLTEPFKKIVRDLDFQLTHLKQAVVATDILNALTLQMCSAQGENSCLPEVTELLAKKLTHLRQLQRNLMLEMIKTQDQAEKVSKNLNNLKEQTFAQMTQTIKNYSCCLKGLSFTVTDNDCNKTPADSTSVDTSTVQSEVEQTTVSVLDRKKAQYSQQCLDKGNFLCDNQYCLPPDYRCDGDDDCGDGSDEASC